MPGFGYLMPIRPDRYRPCIDLVSGRQEIGFPELVLACLELADCFLRLHARGLCYRDISFGNVFLDPAAPVREPAWQLSRSAIGLWVTQGVIGALFASLLASAGVVGQSNTGCPSGRR